MAKMPAFMMAKFEKKDKASDKKAGIKEDSKADMKKDAKMMKGVKAAAGGMMPAMSNKGGASRGLTRAAAMSGRTMPKANVNAYAKGGMVRATKPVKKGC